MLFTCDSFIYRAVRSPLIKLLCCHYDKSRCFSIFLLRCSNVYCIHILFVVKLAFNFIRSWFVTLYFSGSHFSVTYQFYDFIHDLFLFFDINTQRAVIRLFVNTTQQSAVFHLTKCQASTLYSMLLFLLLLIVLKEFSNSRDLI